MSDENITIPASAMTSTVSKNVASREGGRWSNEAKADVVYKMSVLGNTEVVSALTGVDVSTINSWKKTEWYKEAMASHRYDKNLEVDVKIQKVVDKALDIVADRMENGDQVLNNKTGEIVNKPVSMKDASLVARDLLVRQQAMRKEEEGAVQVKETTNDILKGLAKEFAKWARKDNNEATDLPFVEVVKE